MEKDKQDVGSWVDARMAALNSMTDWQPNAARALAVLRHRRRIRQAGSFGAIAAAVAAGLVLMALSGPRACANPVECANEADQAAPIAKDLVRNYKESGPANAKVTCEIY